MQEKNIEKVKNLIDIEIEVHQKFISKNPDMLATAIAYAILEELKYLKNKIRRI